MKPLFFTEPPKTIGEILERGSSLDADREYTILSASAVKWRRVAFVVVFVLLALFLCALTYAIFEDNLLASSSILSLWFLLLWVLIILSILKEISSMASITL